MTDIISSDMLYVRRLGNITVICFYDIIYAIELLYVITKHMMNFTSEPFILTKLGTAPQS